MYFPRLHLNHSAPLPSIFQTLPSTLCLSLSLLGLLTQPLLIALLCQMSQPIVPPVKGWWGACTIRALRLVGLTQLNKEGRDEWSSLLNADAISSQRLTTMARDRRRAIIFQRPTRVRFSGTHIFAFLNLMSESFSWINWCWVTDTWGKKKFFLYLLCAQVKDLQ